jgi:hypothetical protein
MIITSPKTISPELLETISDNLREAETVFTEIENIVNLANDVEVLADDLGEDFSADLDKYMLDEEKGEKQTKFIVKWGERLEKLEEKVKELVRVVERQDYYTNNTKPRPLEILDKLEREVLTN